MAIHHSEQEVMVLLSGGVDSKACLNFFLGMGRILPFPGAQANKRHLWALRTLLPPFQAHPPKSTVRLLWRLGLRRPPGRRGR
jgi:hypothetical protein